MSTRVVKKPAPVKVEFSAQLGRAHLPFLRANLRRALPHLKTRLRDVSIAIVGDPAMSKLHLQFMNIPGPTDVLTFELDHDSRGRPTSGEIVLCLPEARRRAKEHGSSLPKELLLYALHGLLHLSGYDDQTAADFRAIHREEDRILGRIGVGPVFGSAVKPAAARKPAAAKKDGRHR